jgi:hypothetical protein
MKTLRATFRLLLTASLMLSLSMANLYPQLMAGNARAAGVVKDQSPRVCCCGTKDGKCCGMACCQRGIPKPDKTPAPPNRSDDHGQPLGLAGVDATIDGSDAAEFGGVTLNHAASSGNASLVASGIRLNV